MAEGAIRVDGLRELNRAFARADRTLRLEKTKALRDSAESVRVDAEGLAHAEIPNMTPTWSRMRVGVTTKVVYVAPRERGQRRGNPRSRPKFGTKLLNEAMVPALHRNREQVVRDLEQALGEMERAWAR